MPYIELADRTPIHYLDEGARGGRAIVLIPAEPLSCWFWQRNLRELAGHQRVVAIDLRGRGESGKTEGGHNIRQFARDLDEVLNALDISRFLGVGWSIGGSVLWDYIDLFGDARLAGLINVDQRPYRAVDETRLLGMLHEIRVNRIAWHVRRLREYLGPEFDQDEAVIEMMVHECMKTPTAAHLAALEDAYRRDFRPAMTRVRVPTQIFVGRYGLIDPAMAEHMQSATGAELVYFAHSGHLLPWTESDRFNVRVARFAARTLAARGDRRTWSSSAGA